jgi:hypothetical protein
MNRAVFFNRQLYFERYLLLEANLPLIFVVSEVDKRCDEILNFLTAVIKGAEAELDVFRG